MPTSPSSSLYHRHSRHQRRQPLRRRVRVLPTSSPGISPTPALVPVRALRGRHGVYLLLGIFADTNLNDDDQFDSLGFNMSLELATYQNLVPLPGIDFAVYSANFAFSVDTVRAPVIRWQLPDNCEYGHNDILETFGFTLDSMVTSTSSSCCPKWIWLRRSTCHARRHRERLLHV